MAGIKVVMSLSEASKKALLNMAIPPSLIFTSCFFKISSLMFLAASTTSTTSVGFSPGNWTVTVTAVDLWPGSCKRPIIDGSVVTISLILSNSDCSNSSA